MSEPALREYTQRQIQNQTKDRPATEITALSLGSGFFTGFSSIKEFSKLQRLDIVAMNPRVSTKDLECDVVLQFTSLRQLNLNDNAIDRLPTCFAEMFPAVRKIEVSNNSIGKDIVKKSGDEEEAILAAIGPLTMCTQLVVLDLESNPICQVNGYREIVFRLIPSLQVLDSKNKAGEEVDPDEGFSSDAQEDSGEEFDEDMSSDFMEDDEELDEALDSDEPSEQGEDVETKVDNPIKKMKIDA